MRKLRTPWRWPLSVAGALLLLLLLAAGAARYYPRGDLSHLTSHALLVRPLVVIGEVNVVPDPEPVIEELDEEDEPPPEPEPSLIQGLWRDYIVVLNEDVVAVRPRLELPPSLTLTPDISFFARVDTSQASRLLWSAQLQNGLRGSWLAEGRRRDHGRKAGDFHSRKALIFNEDWLGSADLR